MKFKWVISSKYTCWRFKTRHESPNIAYPRHTIAPHKAKSMANLATTYFSQNCQLKIPSSLLLRKETPAQIWARLNMWIWHVSIFFKFLSKWNTLNTEKVRVLSLIYLRFSISNMFVNLRTSCYRSSSGPSPSKIATSGRSFGLGPKFEQHYFNYFDNFDP